MFPTRKSVVLVLGLVAGVVWLAAVRLWQPADAVLTPADPQTHPVVPSSPTVASDPFADRGSNAERTRADSSASAVPAGDLAAGAQLLRRAEACLRPELADAETIAPDLMPIWRCLQDLDWSRVAPADLATWLCASRRPLLQASLVIGSTLYARPPKDALAFLAEYSPACLEVRETGLQIMAVEAIQLVDPGWVLELERSMTSEALFTGRSSEQGIKLAELFIRNGNTALATILENGGRGEYGGSDGEISRAARVSLFLTSTGQWDPDRSDRAWEYADSLVSCRTTPSIVGNVLGR